MVIYKGNPRHTHFREVDLDIVSSSNLQPLVTVMGKAVFVLQVGRAGRTHSAHLELAAVTSSADSTIRRFCTLIQALPRTVRQLWNTARIRDFNIGVQAAGQPHSFEIALSADTVKTVSKIGARIVFTIYAPEERGSASTPVR